MLSINDIKLVYPTGQPSMANITTPLGGPPSTGNLVNSTNTGIFPTGTSNLPGGSTYNRYAKVHFLHTGSTGTNNNLADPFIYITNHSIDNQVSLAADPYFYNTDSAQTGYTANRTTLPNGLSAANFIGYTVDNPLRISELPRGSYTLASGSSIGIWVKQNIQAGLVSSASNNFQLVLRGNIV